MNAVISGQSATALIIDGERLTSIHAADKQRPVSRRPADLHFLFGDCNDLQFLEDVASDQVVAHLKRACNNEDALQMILILLDPELSKKARASAAEALEALLTDALVSEYLQSLLSARPLPEGADLDGAMACCKLGSAVLVRYFLEILQKFQPQDSRLRP